jgi:uncharacterized protein YybS (DUF2232 family)
VQHLAHVAESLQQPPSQVVAGLAQLASFLQQLEQPLVTSNVPTAITIANIIMVFIFSFLGFCRPELFQTKSLPFKRQFLPAVSA